MNKKKVVKLDETTLRSMIATILNEAVPSKQDYFSRLDDLVVSITNGVDQIKHASSATSDKRKILHSARVSINNALRDLKREIDKAQAFVGVDSPTGTGPSPEELLDAEPANIYDPADVKQARARRDALKKKYGLSKL